MVERVTGQDLQLRALPDTSRSFNTSGAFGEQVGQAMQQAGDVVSQFAVNWQKEKNADAVVQGDNALSEWENSYLNDKDNGVYAKTGMNTDGVTKQANMDFEKQVRKVTENMNPAAAKAFKRLAAQRREAFNRGVARHELSEFTKYRQNNADAMIAASAERIAHNAGDEDIRHLELKRIRGAIDSTWHGQSKEFRDVKYNAARSVINTNIVETMLNRGQVDRAEAFYNRDDVEFSAEDRVTIERMLKDQNDLRKATAAADSAILSGSLGEATKQVSKIKDPGVRDQAQTKVDQHFRRQEIVRADAENQVSRAAQAHLETGGTLDTLTPKLRDQAKQIPGLWDKLEALANRNTTNQVNDPEAYESIRQDYLAAMQGDQEAVDKFMKMNLFKEYSDVLDDAHYKQVDAMREAIVSGNIKTQKDQEANVLKVSTDAAVMKTLFKSVFGSQPTRSTEPKAHQDWNRRYAQMEAWYQSQLTQWQAANPSAKAVPDEVRRKILDQMEITVTYKNPSWWSSSPVTHSLGDIPADTWDEVVQDLEDEGVPVTPYNIRRVLGDD